jgi:glycosyltransferase involved in cell wall biosynthesis
MRIAYFTDTPRLGGAERYLANIAAGAQAAGHEIVTVSPQEFMLELLAKTAPGARAVLASIGDVGATAPLKRTAALARAVPSLAALFRRLQPSLVHVNNGGFPGSDLCRFAPAAAALAGVPLRLLSVHSAPWPRASSEYPRIQAAADQLVWRSVDAVLATTAFVADGLRTLRKMPPAICRHVPYGVAEPSGARETDAIRRRFVEPRDALFIGMVSATGDGAKGHHVLAEALARIHQPVHAVVVGPHPGEPFLELLKQLRVADRVHCVGPVDSTDVGQYLHAIDALVVPSTAYESLPLVILEAMAVGKPVFASRLSGIPEAIVPGKTGELFTPGSVEELTALIEAGDRDRKRLSRLGNAGRTRWRSRFSVEALQTSVLSLYEELAHARGFAA